MCKIAEWGMALFLVAAAYKDWKTRRVSVLLLTVMTVLAFGAAFFTMKDSLLSAACGAAIGAFFFLFSKYTKEAVGYGDSWVIFLLGVFLGGKALLEIILGAFLLSSLFLVIYGIRHGFHRKQTIPFIPFLMTAYMGVVFL